MVLISHSHLCSQRWSTALSGIYYIPPENGWWSCSTGLTPCIHSTVLNTSKDFCVMVQMVPHLVYHPHMELLHHWNGAAQCQKREALIVLTVSLFLGLGNRGAATGASALALQGTNYESLWKSMDIDIKRIETFNSHLQESFTSCSEVVLENCRGLDLLFIQEGGLGGAAINEECCFYIEYSGVVKDSMTKVQKRLA